MIKALRKRLTYANVMATLAVFIALGGSSYAAFTVTGSNVKNSSLTFRDLRGTPRGAAGSTSRGSALVRSARNADRLNGVTAERFLVRCPEGTFPVSNVCVETRGARTGSLRNRGRRLRGHRPKRRPGRRLPSHDELMTAIGEPGIALAAGGELTRNVYPSGSVAGEVDVLFVTSNAGSVGITPNTAAGAKAFRCVADPRN